MTGLGPGYGHEPLFGVILTPDAHRPERVVDLALHAERVGLDVVSVSDHPYQPGFLDAWTLLSWIAARTRRVNVLPNVANLLLRPPAGTARAAASLDALSGGRVALGLGAGGHGEAIHSEGGPRLTVGERVDAFAEAVRVVRALATPGPPATLDGRYHRLREAVPGPPHPRPIGLWIGAVGPRMLRLVGRLGDGWLPSATRVPPHALDAGHARIDEAARAAGRDPSAIRRLYNIPAPPGVQAGTGPWADQLTRIAVRHGISGFLLFSDERATISRFGEEVAPRVRKALA
ncbi:LLM class flavin-dependent oxidoreductase [Streptomyces sp. 3MP-14]|uniref:LLM class flavin-dependent oxidoreductase n=1 Tax=Streptomyces mimosae TaxID=2586635 RepID=A0A5N6AA41_9ACTN|nr:MULTISPECIES: LLM class flavin-dependent oxidoreductase [Streptomyces]KAB8164620.1 LLM class flavin-dependent oxidoreductase [Streptomyces mimosae]KAB8175536.1 LLM class flavin-dependent oxidoreductase [Streptomyces sp. 3MP-14]